jgi:ACS family hexuronate transporter-like MFS transporter
MLFFAASINYLDRQVLGLLAPTLQHSIGWTEAQYGYIVGGFQFAYAVGLILSGRLVDKLGCRIGYVIIMAFWSLASMGHALAASALGFGIARFFLGLGESGSFPAAIKTTAEWFPQRERALVTGIFNSGTNVGAILAPAFIPWITLKFGWHAAFLATGLFGALWIVWWIKRYYSPEDHPRVSASELQYIRDDPAEPVAQIPWTKLLTYRQTWAYSAAKFLTDPIWYFYLYWLPKFLDSRYHLGLGSIGLPLIVVYNMSAVGSIGGGWLPTAFNKAGMSMAQARLSAMLICACLILPIFLASRVNSLWSAVGILGLATAAMVRESDYDCIGYVPAQLGWRSRRYRWNGWIGGLRPIFIEHRVGAAISAQLCSFVLGCCGFVSCGDVVSADSGAGPQKSRCASGGLSATGEPGAIGG